MPKRKRKITRRKKKKTLSIELSETATHEISAIIYACLAIISILSINNSAGITGSYFRYYMQSAFGRGVWFFPISLIVMSLSLFFSKNVRIHATKLLGIILAFFSLLGLIHMQTTFMEQMDNIKSYGGYVGLTMSFFLRHFFGDTGGTILLVGLLLIGVIIVSEISIGKLLKSLNPKKIVKINIKKSDKNDDLKIFKPKFTKDDNKPEKLTTFRPVISKPDEIEKEPNKPNNGELQIDRKDYSRWVQPALTLLESSNSKLKIDEKALVKNAGRIKEKLSQFGIDVTMKDINVGPTVTQYTLQPSSGVKLTKITTLKNDLALALAAKAIRIEAPIPGQSLVGIEIPNTNRMIVHLKEIMESSTYKNIKSNLRLPIGRDVSGKPRIADLSKMPHVLIAGRTGSGKSVCMNAFLISLLYQNSPKELKMILIDPKRVELMPYNGIPHLLTSVITDVDKATAALRWTVAEMTRRYTELSQKRYRNLNEYNEGEKDKMNNIVVVIDELADLMMRNNKKEVELLICRLAQMARAVGIHLIIATQRPSVDVITGLIKANIPSRIAFAVASGVDSRTILDTIGAEDLLGLGDMLMETNGIEGMIRIQGILVTRKEIEKVTNKIKISAGADYNEHISLNNQTNDKNTDTNQISFEFADIKDDKFEEAIDVIKKTGKASATLLQRHLSIGYARAAKILDLMEEKNMIGPSNGAKARKIYFLEEDNN